MCILESFLDSTIPDDDNLHTEGYNLIRADHPDNIRSLFILQKEFSFKEN